MKFLDMKCPDNKPEYEWYRSVSGSWHHWERRVLGGEIILHVEGHDDIGYWYTIRCESSGFGFFSSLPDDENEPNVPFKTPENAALHADEKWKEIINKEVNRNKI